ncbi:1662_t:CDS:2 [Diversispora eburnea]|uniref:1662_t:CDS:1 n=1 Tax=Diversispora eburnea TaxID=1213867 RepID=A0A9N8W9R2_9GLOM|nr:1662_t:CDS:2 [Diversispora eburnea]
MPSQKSMKKIKSFRKPTKKIKKSPSKTLIPSKRSFSEHSSSQAVNKIFGVTKPSVNNKKPSKSGKKVTFGSGKNKSIGSPKSNKLTSILKKPIKDTSKIKNEVMSIDHHDPDSEGEDSSIKQKKINDEPSAKRFKKEKPDQARIKTAFEHKKYGNRKLDPEYRSGIKECWEFARKLNLSPKDRKKYINELFELIDGIIPELLFKHDTSRIIQTGLKYGTKEQRIKVANELEGRWIEVFKSKYAKFVACKIMQYCPGYKNIILSELQGNVAKLLMHTEARNVLLEAYECANGKQRFSLIKEFYGPEFKFFKKTECLKLEDLIAENPSNKDKIVENLYLTIKNFMKKPEILNFIIPHRILLDFLTHANEVKILSIIQLIDKHIPEILHTREGSRAAMLCFSHANAKERKSMLQVMRDYIKKICCEEYGHLVLLRVFDVVDDTVLMKKCIIDKMIKENSFETILYNKYGHRVILYLLTGRSRMYFNYDTLKLLAQNDEIRVKTSKKDPIIRATELRKLITPALIQYSQNNTAKMLSNPYTTQILCETILYGESKVEEKIPILENITKLISDTPKDSKDNIMITYANRFLKILVRGQHWTIPKQRNGKNNGKIIQKNNLSESNRTKNGATDSLEQDFSGKKVELHFAPMLLNTIKNDLSYYSCHETASFVILALLENDETKNEVKNILMKGINSIKKAALEDNNSGASIIIKELE